MATEQKELIKETYYRILEEELVPALGCTEPIAVAFAASYARKLLEAVPTHMNISCSGNIIKNVKGVVTPNSEGMKGIDTAAILGMLGGSSELKLETLSTVTKEDIEKTKSLRGQDGFCDISLIEGGSKLHIIVEAFAGEHRALVEIEDYHTNITRVERDDKVLLDNRKATDTDEDCAENKADRRLLSVREIIEFAETAELERLIPLLDKQIRYNSAISTEGLKNSYGTQVGRNLMKHFGDSVHIRAAARAAAGSDARMSGCDLPVVINSGSGNQGLTVSLPVITYANELGVSSEKLYRALIISNLVAIHQKTQIGNLSAFCGAVTAACGSGAAVTWLAGGTYPQICDTITNTLANVSGIVCDGAKASCAAKVATAVNAALLGHYMSMDDCRFQPGDGIIKDDIEQTVASVGRLGKFGMRETDTEILNIMINS